MKWISYRKLRFFVASILFICISGGILYAVRYGFEVKRIEFLGEGMQAEIDDRQMSENIIFFPSDKIKKELLSQYPQLKDVQIKKQFPHTIVIIPVLRQAVATLVTQKASYGIDEEARVVGIGMNSPGLPELQIDVPSVRVGGTVIDEKVRSALLFLKQSTSFIPVSLIRTSDDGSSLVAKTETTEILFTQTQDIDTLISTLQTIITGIRIKGTMPKYIDVRFSKPVIQW